MVQLPLFLRQITGRFSEWAFILKLALLIIVVQRYHFNGWKRLLYCWLSAEVLLAVIRMGQRSEVVLLLMAACLLYHRLVSPFKLKLVIPCGLLFLLGFLFFGLYRNMDLDRMQVDFQLLSAGNEFQSVLGTGYDLFMRKKFDSLHVPWQVYISDLLALIPRQICPIQKIDVGEWYLGLLGIQGGGTGYTFGVVGQSVIGLDWWEFVLRGAVLGFLFARIHRWYILKGSNFLVTLCYLWLCVRAYYTFRGTTFSIVSSIVYAIVPVFLIIRYLPGAFIFIKNRKAFK